MSLRTRIAMLTIAATTITIAVAATLTVTIVGRVMLGQVDDQLERRITLTEGRGLMNDIRRSAEVDTWVVDEQRLIIVSAFVDGEPVPDTGIAAGVALPYVELTRGEIAFTTIEVSGVPVRAALVVFPDGSVLRVMRAIDDVQALRSRTGLAVGGLGIALALLGAIAVWLVVGRSLQPLRRLAQAAAAAGHTGDLSALRAPQEDASRDEVGELSRSLSGMAESVEQAREAQRRLVDDAAHELRTPLTSMRANLELLQRAASEGRLDEQQVREALRDAVDESEDLTHLIAELVASASAGVQDHREPTDVDLVALASEVVERTRRRSGRAIELVESTGSVVRRADAPMLERALGNVLGNAVKFAPTPARIVVTVDDAGITVDDAGPGIAPEHRHHVTQRFWRAPESRGLPGSGLGLSIVADVLAANGGSVVIGESPLGGARVCLRLAQETGPAGADGASLRS